MSGTSTAVVSVQEQERQEIVVGTKLGDVEGVERSREELERELTVVSGSGNDVVDEGLGEQELPKYADVQAAVPNTSTVNDTVPSVNIVEPPTQALQDTPSSTSPFTTEHVYTLKNSRGRSWLTLRISSRASQGKSHPIYHGEDVISGTVETDLEKAEGSKGVTIALRGETTSVGQEGVPFIAITETLWSPPSSSSSKLIGKNTWPFTLKLPSEVILAESFKAEKKPYALPPTFTERASPAYIDYKIIVTVRRGAFRVNHVLTTPFALIPQSIAPLPSPLRRLAYSEGSAVLVGPDGDPDGWSVLSNVNVKGMLFDTKVVDVECSLALANPLTYALNSPIPLRLTLRCRDDVVLDLFSSSTAAAIHLTRSIAIGSEASNDTAPRRSNNTFLEHVGKAFFWPEPGDGRATVEDRGAKGIVLVKTLHGEIDVRKGLKPSFVFPRFTTRYYVNIMPFNVPGFTSSTPIASAVSGMNIPQPLLSQKVTIVTANAPGVIPQSHAPPGYVRPEEGDYNNSMGYLENGNQRFYHHHPGF